MPTLTWPGYHYPEHCGPINGPSLCKKGVTVAERADVPVATPHDALQWHPDPALLRAVYGSSAKRSSDLPSSPTDLGDKLLEHMHWQSIYKSPLVSRIDRPDLGVYRNPDYHQPLPSAPYHPVPQFGPIEVHGAFPKGYRGKLPRSAGTLTAPKPAWPKAGYQGIRPAERWGYNIY